MSAGLGRSRGRTGRCQGRPCATPPSASCQSTQQDLCSKTVALPRPRASPPRGNRRAQKRAHLGHCREERLEQGGHGLGALDHPGAAGHGPQQLMEGRQPGGHVARPTKYPPTRSPGAHRHALHMRTLGWCLRREGTGSRGHGLDQVPKPPALPSSEGAPCHRACHPLLTALLPCQHALFQSWPSGSWGVLRLIFSIRTTESPQCLPGTVVRTESGRW